MAIAPMGTILASETTARIESASIGGCDGEFTVKYSLVWWNGRERREAWFGRDEFRPVKEKPALTIGFRG